MKKFAIKKDGKWLTIGSYGINKYGNESLSINRKNLVAFLKDESAEWLNVSVFDEKPKDENSEVPPQEGGNDEIPDKIPF